MSCKSLLALSLVGAMVLFLTGSASADPCLSPTPACRPVYSSAPVRPPVCPGQLPEQEPEPIRHTMTIFNGAHVVQQNFVEQNGSWRNCGDFKNYDVFFRDCPRSPWHLQGTYYSFRRAQEVAGSLRAHGNLTEVRPACR